MKAILSKGHLEVLRQFAWSNVLIGLDFDGTLAPIVARPDAAAMNVRTRQLLSRLCRAYPCVVISGRGQEDVNARVAGLGLVEVVGNHGLDPAVSPLKFKRLVNEWRPHLQQVVDSFPGLEVEDKKFSLAVHYRKSREKKRALGAILDVVDKLKDARVIRGKLVVNVVPKDAPHKGSAVERLRARHACDTALYVGDDETDEDVFTLDQPGELLCIRVGLSQRSQAPYYLQGQAEVDRLLETLISIRTEHRTEKKAAR
jgi:trehalose 6-phosphate phosphatase